MVPMQVLMLVLVVCESRSCLRFRYTVVLPAADEYRLAPIQLLELKVSLTHAHAYDSYPASSAAAPLLDVGCVCARTPGFAPGALGAAKTQQLTVGRLGALWNSLPLCPGKRDCRGRSIRRTTCHPDPGGVRWCVSGVSRNLIAACCTFARVLVCSSLVAVVASL